MSCHVAYVFPSLVIHSPICKWVWTVQRMTDQVGEVLLVNTQFHVGQCCEVVVVVVLVVVILSAGSVVQVTRTFLLTHIQ